ncbi:MAG: hypothetical protein J6S92_01950 [Oscillospiraceae bacterium]|nr:hypothetical protein [Oscillospiraceae bacterium]MBP0987024.1 hypothetical protein [Oscillospiraceae bacterium]
MSSNITSADYFIVNGVSSASVGLYVDTPPVPPMAKQRVTTWSTGADADGHSPDDVYENIKITVNAYSFFPDTFDFSAVYAFLADARTLMFSRFPNRFLKVVQVDAVQPQPKWDGKRITLKISFTCEPFKYHTNNPETDVSTERYILNPGTRYSRPVYKITFTKSANDCILSVNGQVCTISRSADSPIWIDTAHMIAYNSDRENMTQHTSGLFPFLSPGDNLLSAYENNTYIVQGLTVVGNWRDY